MSFAPLKRAFSLIELLVSVSILLLLFSGALAAYSRYTEKQRIVAAAEAIEAAIKNTQNRTKIGYLANCTELVSNNIRFWLDNGVLSYQVFTTCVDPSENLYEPRVRLGNDFTLDLGTRLMFYPYGGTIINGVRADGTFSARVNQATSTLSSTRRTDYAVTLTFDRGGGIKVKY